MVLYREHRFGDTIKLFVICCVLLLASGCRTTGFKASLVRKRASFDLRCSQVQVFALGNNAFGAQGCGRQASYLVQCMGGALRRDLCDTRLESMREDYAPVAAMPSRSEGETKASLTVVRQDAGIHQARTPVVIAVLDVVDDENIFHEMKRERMAEYLGTKLASLPGVSLVPREQVRATLEQSKVASYRECIDASCQIEIGKSLAASKVVASRLMKVGFQCVVLTTVFDLRREASDSAASVTTECLEVSIFKALDDVVQQVARNRDGEPPSKSY